MDDLAAHVEHFRARVLQDALAEACSSYWLRRAETFAAVGNAQCDEIARACRNAAEVAMLQAVPNRIICAACSCGEPRIEGIAS